MPFPGAQRKLKLEDGPQILFGLNDTRAEVAAEHRTAPIGSIYINNPTTSGTGRIYYKATESGGVSGTAGDWVRISSSAAD